MLFQMALNFRHLVFFERLELEQGVDEEAVALVCRHATRRRMRRGHETELFKIGHDVTDRCGAQLHAHIARQRTRANRLPVADIVLNKELEQLLSALAQALFSRIDRVRDHGLLSYSTSRPTR